VSAPALHGRLNALQQALKLGLDAFRNDVLADLRLQATFLRHLVGNYLFDGSVYALIGIEQRANLSHVQESRISEDFNASL
jgi:hypothetical protein